MSHPRHHAVTRHAATALLALALVGLMATACGEEQADETTTTTTAEPAGETGNGDTEEDMSDPLDGTVFLSTSVTGRDLVPDSTVRLSFEDGQIGVSAGCNSMGGGYSLDGDQIVIDGEMRSTLMGCEQALMDQDTWLGAWVNAGLTWQLDGTTLTLTGDDVTMELAAEQPAGDGTVEGAWQLDTIIDGETAASVPADVETPTLEVTGDQVNVFTGCNRGGGTVEVADTTLTFGPMRLTRMACDEPAMALEATVTRLLDGAVPYVLKGELLTLGDDDAGLVWRRA